MLVIMQISLNAILFFQSPNNGVSTPITLVANYVGWISGLFPVDHNIQVIIRSIPAIMAVEKNISNNIDVENIIDIVKSKSDQLYP